MDLTSGRVISMCPASEEVLVIKSDRFDFEPHKMTRKPEEMHLDLQNERGDILLRITLRSGTKKIFFNDRASKSLGDGWGKEQSASLEPVRGDPGVTITVHSRSTSSGSNRYQILLGLTTVGHFDSRISGSWTNIRYRNENKWRNEQALDSMTTFAVLSERLKVCLYKIADLLPEERKVFEQEGVPSPENPPLNSTAISIRPSHYIPNQKYASISWDDEKEIRIYYRGPENILQEYAYSESKDRNSWYYGNLHKLNIALDPTSNVVAVRHQDYGVCIFFQNPTDNIGMVWQAGPTGDWRATSTLARVAVRGSSIAVIIDDVRYRVFYQDPELHLREIHFVPLTKWLLGSFNPGVQPRGTPITAEIVQGGDVDLNVTWRDSRGRVASASWSRASGWDLPNPNSAKFLDGRD